MSERHPDARPKPYEDGYEDGEIDAPETVSPETVFVVQVVGRALPYVFATEEAAEYFRDVVLAHGGTASLDEVDFFSNDADVDALVDGEKYPNDPSA